MVLIGEVRTLANESWKRALALFELNFNIDSNIEKVVALLKMVHEKLAVDA
jgi:hypothetical protein